MYQWNGKIVILKLQEKIKQFRMHLLEKKRDDHFASKAHDICVGQLQNLNLKMM